jgi:hypothetical protein
MASIAEANSFFEIDIELDGLLEQIEEQIEFEGQASEELMNRFQQFCEAHGEKVDRIGRFVRMMEAREQYCRSEAARPIARLRPGSTGFIGRRSCRICQINLRRPWSYRLRRPALMWMRSKRQ